MLYFVAAHGNNYEMGYEGGLPWKSMPADIAQLHDIIRDKIVVMGEATYRGYTDIHKSIHAKKAYVLSRSNLTLDDAEVLDDIKEVSIMARDKDVYVIGGASIFKQLIEDVDHMYLTRIEQNFKADRYFPDYSTMNFEMVEAQYFSADDDNPYAYTFLQLRRL